MQSSNLSHSENSPEDEAAQEPKIDSGINLPPGPMDHLADNGAAVRLANDRETAIHANESSSDPGDSPIEDSVQASDRRLGNLWGKFWGCISILVLIGAATIYLSWGLVDEFTQGQPWAARNQVAMRAIDVFIVGWVLWVASAIGSFLNVVAYRIPLGKSLNGRSHCPGCDSQLTWSQNTPILGWIFLGGRCGHCRSKISPRYPIVELAVACSLGCIALTRIYNVPLPHQPVSIYRGQVGGHWLVDLHSWILLALHLMAVTLLWAMALIRFDRGSLPPSIVWMIAPIVMVLLGFPEAGIEDWRQQATPLASIEIQQSGGGIQQGGGAGVGIYLDGLVRCLTAIVAAVLIGRSLARGLNPKADLKLSPLGKDTRRLVDLIAMNSIVALIVGWQATIAVVVLASGIAVILSWTKWGPTWMLNRSLSDPLSRFAVALPIALTVQISAWRWLHEREFWPSDQSSPIVILVWASVALCIPIWLRGGESLAVAAPRATQA